MLFLGIFFLFLLNFAGAARRKLMPRNVEQQPWGGTKQPGSPFKGYCTEVAQGQWRDLNFVVDEDKADGKAYLHCRAGNHQIRYKVSCREEHCTKGGKIKDNQVENQQGWCFVRNGCGKYSTKGRCQPLDYAPVTCRAPSARSDEASPVPNKPTSPQLYNKIEQEVISEVQASLNQDVSHGVAESLDLTDGEKRFVPPLVEQVSGEKVETLEEDTIDSARHESLEDHRDNEAELLEEERRQQLKAQKQKAKAIAAIEQELRKSSVTAEALTAVLNTSVRVGGLSEDDDVVTKARRRIEEIQERAREEKRRQELLQAQKLKVREAEEAIRREMKRQGVTYESLSAVVDTQTRRAGLNEKNAVVKQARRRMEEIYDPEWYPVELEVVDHQNRDVREAKVQVVEGDHVHSTEITDTKGLTKVNVKEGVILVVTKDKYDETELQWSVEYCEGEKKAGCWWRQPIMRSM